MRGLSLQDMQKFYEQLHKREGAAEVMFPEQYPTGALVGQVNVVGCLRVRHLHPVLQQ